MSLCRAGWHRNRPCDPGGGTTASRGEDILRVVWASGCPTSNRTITREEGRDRQETDGVLWWGIWPTIWAEQDGPHPLLSQIHRRCSPFSEEPQRGPQQSLLQWARSCRLSSHGTANPGQAFSLLHSRWFLHQQIVWAFGGDSVGAHLHRLEGGMRVSGALRWCLIHCDMAACIHITETYFSSGLFFCVSDSIAILLHRNFHTHPCPHFLIKPHIATWLPTFLTLTGVCWPAALLKFHTNFCTLFQILAILVT